MTLNLKSPEGVAILKKLVEKADVLVENFRPDVKRKLGIDYETMAAVNPRLVYASISGYGEDGPYRLRPGFDQIAQGMGGLMSITGLPGQGPVRVGIPIADLCAGIFCAYGIAVAVIEREKSGRGQWVKSSLLQAQLFMLSVPPPGAYGTTTSMFFDGYFAWPKAAPDGANARASDIADTPRSCRRFISKFLRCEESDLQARCIATRCEPL